MQSAGHTVEEWAALGELGVDTYCVPCDSDDYLFAVEDGSEKGGGGQEVRRSMHLDVRGQR